MLNFLIILIIPLIQFRQGMVPYAILKIAEHCLLINSWFKEGCFGHCEELRNGSYCLVATQANDCSKFRVPKYWNAKLPQLPIGRSGCTARDNPFQETKTLRCKLMKEYETDISEVVIFQNSFPALWLRQ